MMVEIKETITLLGDEQETLRRATGILNGITSRLTDFTSLIDVQEIPDEVIGLVLAALEFEDQHIFSVFNIFDHKLRAELTQSIKSNKQWFEGRDKDECERNA